ncbi:ArsR/SmtB family transcription factor [Nocardia sp. NPDC006044]|uniref:ArsR/SmtB family transcription factor n=1 Tax=Nocardia sp. NPDC006044 TaxID=3364306 RepID=UPI0036BCF228
MTGSAEKIFEALGDPVRRYILELVADGEQAAGTVVAAVQRYTRISQPGVSQHLKVLREAGLVRVRAEGTRRFYLLDVEGVEAAQSWLAHLVDPVTQFAQPLDALATEVARGRRARKAEPGRSAGESSEPDVRHA